MTSWAVLPALLLTLVKGEGPPSPTPATTETSDEAPLKKVAVFDLRAPQIPEGARAGLMAVLTEAVARDPGLRVVSRDEIAAMLDAEAQKQLVGCNETSCLAEIAGALDVDLLVAGSLNVLGGGQLITLQLINQRYANVMNRVTLTWSGPSEQLDDVLEAAAQLLILEPAQRQPASLRVNGSVPGAAVVLDEHPSGTITADGSRKFDGLDVGVHQLKLSAAGHTPRTIAVVARSGEEVVVHGVLDPVPIYGRWWFWTGVGLLSTGAVAAAVAIAVSLTDTTGGLVLSAPDPVNP